MRRLQKNWSILSKLELLPRRSSLLTHTSKSIKPNLITSFCFLKKNYQKVAFWCYFNKRIFGLDFKIFCLRLKTHMSMIWKPTSNNSYGPFNNSRLTVYLNPQRGIWKWVIKIIAHFMLFVFYSLAVNFLVGSMLLSNSKW